MTAPADLSLVDLLPLLESRALSACELVEDCLARVDAHEAVVRAFVALTPEHARAAAARADADRAAGRPVGPLAGVPVVLKDLYLTAGTPTTASSRVLQGHDPGVDAELWVRLRAAGAGLLGKTTLHEFAYGTGSFPTANPWDLSRTPGGSSGGSAAALAARMVPVALGTDTGGSLRLPASACGVSSLRCAPGRLPTGGVLPLAPSFDVAGPMARRMRDVAKLLRLLADDPPPYPDAPSEDLRGTRIGLPTSHLWEDLDEDVERVCRDALQHLVDRGAELVPVDVPPGADEVLAVPGSYGHVVHVEALAVHERRLAETPELYGDDVRGRLAAARSTTPEQLALARAQGAAWAAAWRERLADLDAVACPTLPGPPPSPASCVVPLVLAKGWSVAGVPALSVPAGLDHRGLPVGLQLAGLPEREASLVGLGLVVDEAVGLWRRNPLAPA